MRPGLNARAVRPATRQSVFAATGPINQLAKNVPGVYFSSPLTARRDLRRSACAAGASVMTENKTSLRYWVVNCLGCKNPIPLFAEAIDPAASSAGGGMTSERPFFRVWCMECGREFPYLSEAMIWTDEPPHDKHHRQLEFSRFRQRFQVKRAHA